MTREDPQFNLRMPLEIKEKVKQRARMNGRSLNSEILQIINDALAQPATVSGYRDDAEREADILAQEVRKLVFERASEHYRKEKTRD